MAVATTTYFTTDANGPQRKPWLKPGWPLWWLFAPFPLWWIIGLSHFIFIFAAVAMAWELFKRRPVYVPLAFGFWLLFMVVIFAGVTLLWVQPDGTLPVVGINKLINYIYHLLWYLSITIVAMYIVNLPEREMSSVQHHASARADVRLHRVRRLGGSVAGRRRLPVACRARTADSEPGLLQRTGPSIAGAAERLLGLRPATADRAVRVPQCMGQQHRALHAVLHRRLHPSGQGLAPTARHRRSWASRSSRSSTRSTAACGAGWPSA